jgi:hypothetical protein
MKFLPLFLIVFLYSSCLHAQNDIDKRFIKISQAEFNGHLPPINFLTKSKIRQKLKGIIRIKTPHKTIVLKDDGEMLEYRFEGYVKNTPMILIHQLEPNTEEYYLINKETATIDTLIGEPIFYKNGVDIVCMSGSVTDRTQKLQIGRINNGRFTSKIILPLSNDMVPDYVYWLDKKAIVIQGKYLWRLDI